MVNTISFNLATFLTIAYISILFSRILLIIWLSASSSLLYNSINKFLIGSVNNNVFIDYNFNNIKHKNLKSITVYDMAKYNKFEDNLKK